VERLGVVPYGPALQLQQERFAAVLADAAPDTLFLLEHTPVVTLGKNTGDGHVLVSAEWLQRQGLELYKTSRGGDVTYHGPGQLVGYPIVKLGDGEQDIRGYVYKLEEILIRTVADFGVTATRIEGLRGIWVEGGDRPAKIGAIGVRVARWVTMHGFALNVAPNLSHFDLIVPCGITDKGVTSLEKLLGKAPALDAVAERLVGHARTVLGREPEQVAPSPLPVLPPGFIVQDGVTL
jgi:lipoyl(octanoyl) transferase